MKKRIWFGVTVALSLFLSPDRWLCRGIDGIHSFDSVTALSAQDDEGGDDLGGGGDAGGDAAGGDAGGDAAGGDSAGGDAGGGDAAGGDAGGDAGAGGDDLGGGDTSGSGSGGGGGDATPPPAPVAVRVPYAPGEKDPFDVLVKKEIIIPQTTPDMARRQTNVVVDDKPKPPPVPPVNLQIMGIVGNDSKRIGLVKFENESLTVSKGFTDQKGKFKVVDIEKDKVIIYSFKEGFRKTFKLPEVKMGDAGGGGGDAGGGADMGGGGGGEEPPPPPDSGGEEAPPPPSE